MEQDIVAHLYPCSDNARRAVEELKANPRYVPPLLGPPGDQHDRRSSHDRHERASTEPPENPGASALDYLPSLVVRLSDLPQTDKGLIFGSNPKCDVRLVGLGISNIHFSLSFDEFNRPIIEDLNSLMGTEVTYKEEGKGARRKFRWIVGGHDILDGIGMIVIKIPSMISFQIVVKPHDIASPAYVNGVGRFKQGAATTEALLKDLGISHPPTRGTQTPDSGDIYLKKKTDQGSFGVVRRFWNVSTGEERAVKTPHRRAIRNGQVDQAAWAHEADIMSGISHPHIVKLIDSFLHPQPELHLEYMPYGSLERWLEHGKHVSYSETVMITFQCLSALAYLHGQNTPIAHRDIKPGNILIQSHSEDGIFVKLADFGTARPDLDLTSFCGTRFYLAPEVYSDQERRGRHEKTLGYTTTVDIWSLGVVAYQLLYGLQGCKGLGVALCESIERELRENVQKRPLALGSMLVRCMVIMSPEARRSASECCNVLGKMLRTKGGSFQGLTAVSSSAGEDQATLTPQPLSSVLTTQQYDESQTPSSSTIRRYNKLQYEGHELDLVFKDYSAGGLNPLHYGSTIAAEFGGNDSEDWASDFFQESLQSQAEVQGSSQSQIEVAGSQARTRTTRWSIPRGESEEWRLQEGNAIVADDYTEMETAALLLQTMGGSYRLQR